MIGFLHPYPFWYIIVRCLLEPAAIYFFNRSTITSKIGGKVMKKTRIEAEINIFEAFIWCSRCFIGTADPKDDTAQ